MSPPRPSSTSCNTAFATMDHGKEDGGSDVPSPTPPPDSDSTNGPATSSLTVAASTTGDIPDLAALGQSSIGQRDDAGDPTGERHGGRDRRQRRCPDAAVPRRQASVRRPADLHTTQPSTINSPIDADQAETLTQLMIASRTQHGRCRRRGVDRVEDRNRRTLRRAGRRRNAMQLVHRVRAVVEREGGRRGDRGNGDLGAASTCGAIAGPIGRAVINARLGGAGG